MRVLPSDMPSVGSEQVILDNLSTAVLLFDNDLHLVAINQAAEALLDTSARKVRGSSVYDLFPAASPSAGALVRLLRAGHSCTERDLQLGLPGAKSTTVDCTVTPIRGATEIRGMLVEFVLLDRHKRITREEQLLRQNTTARVLVRGLAHEIRNPLSGLRGAAQLLERELKDQTLAEYTGVIIREADRLQNLLDRMLGPRRPPDMHLINVHQITERVSALIRAETPDEVLVERDYDPSIPEIRADPELIIQATLNVARNAVQALAGSGRISFRTRVHRHMTIGHRHHRLVVSIDICDDGPGIPSEIAGAIFYPMVSGRNGGSGLGLPIAQSLVAQHGGLIECTSGAGETRFSILLPVEENAHG